MMKKLKLIIPQGNQKELKEITQIMGKLAIDMGTLNVSIKDAMEKAILSRTRNEKRNYDELAKLYQNMFNDLNNKLIEDAKGNNVSTMIIQGITDMGIKLVNTMKESAVPMIPQQQDPTAFNQQLIFTMIGKLPKIKELFRVTRDDNHQLKFIPKEGKKEECVKACNAFFRQEYNIDAKEITPDINFDIITLSKYKTSTSPPSTQELVLEKKKNKGKERIEGDKIFSTNIFETTPSSSSLPPKLNTFTINQNNKPKPVTIQTHPILTMKKN